MSSRLRDIREARIAIDAAFQPDEATAPAGKARSPFAWIAAASIFALSLAALAFIHFGETPPERQHLRFQINPPGQLTSIRLSPDGKFLAMITAEAFRNKIWVRSLDRLDTQLLTDMSEGIDFAWSQDGRYIAFQSGEKVYKIARSGGPPAFLAAAPPDLSGGVWLDGGVNLLTSGAGLYRFPASGGSVTRINEQNSFGPAWLPGGQFLYSRADGVFVGSLDGSKTKRILPDGVRAEYVPPPKGGAAGHLLFVRADTLLAQPFNASKSDLQGDAILIADHLGNLVGIGGAFSASLNGVLVFWPGGGKVVLTWLDRSGKTLQSVSKPFKLAYNPAVRLSPSDSQAIVPVDGPDGPNLWIADFNRNTFSRLTFETSTYGLWSPDGRKILWADNNFNYYLRSADGSGTNELLYKNPTPCHSCFIYDWSQDGKLISFAGLSDTNTVDIWTVGIEGDRKPVPYRHSHFNEFSGQISPDSRWMAYASDESGQNQVYLESIPAGKKRWQISTEGAEWPLWQHDGKELFYRQGTKLMAVPIRLAEKSVEIGKPQALFDVPPSTRFQVSRDGQRFLIAMPEEGGEAGAPPLTVDTDWRAGLKK